MKRASFSGRTKAENIDGSTLPRCQTATVDRPEVAPTGHNRIDAHALPTSRRISTAALTRRSNNFTRDEVRRLTFFQKYYNGTLTQRYCHNKEDNLIAGSIQNSESPCTEHLRARRVGILVETFIFPCRLVPD